MKTLYWVLKTSKLCNLRCTYCYEWNELHLKDRMSVELLAKIFVAVREQHEQSVREHGRTRTYINWAGGEPLIQPVSFYRTLLDLQRETFGADALARLEYQNVVQTNAFSIKDEMIEFLKESLFNVGVSLDVVPGVRLSVSGQQTERQVLRNVARLRAAGLGLSAIVVLAKHTAPKLSSIFDFFVDHGFRKLRVLPLFEGPPERPADTFLVEPTVLTDALCRLFEHWFTKGMPIEVAPLNDYLYAALRHMARIRHRLVDRRVDGDPVLVVNTNGDVYQFIDAYDPLKALGNLGEQTRAEIWASGAYSASLTRTEQLSKSLCGSCELAGYCSGWPALASPELRVGDSRCQLAQPVQRYIESYLRERGIGEAELGAWLKTTPARAVGPGIDLSV
jgi:uncharacterized protein